MTRRLSTRLLSIGADARDDEDLRLRKVLLLTGALMVLPAGVVWGGVYWFLGESGTAALLWGAVAVGIGVIALLAATRDYRTFAILQFAIFLALPFLLTWSLGGFVASSAIVLWAWIGPTLAAAMGHRRGAAVLAATVAGGFLVSALLEPILKPSDTLPEPVVVALLLLNVATVMSITLVLVDAAAGGREGSIESMRRIVHRYLSPDVAQAVLADPERQELGGELTQVTVLFADLGGYTSFSEARSPREVVALLNTLFAAAVPAVLAEGGTLIQLPGDAVMAVFGAPRMTPDHALDAARAALRIQSTSQESSVGQPDWPRFRIGVNTGEALVGNIGSDQFRNFTVIGDTVNTAQRLQAIAEPGQVVVGSVTAAALGDAAVIDWLGDVAVKGKREPLRPGILRSLPPSTPTVG